MTAAAAEVPEGEPSTIEIPPLLPVLPLREGVIFPMSVAPVVIQDERAIRAVEDSMRTHRILCVVAQRDGASAPLSPASLYSTGCAAAIGQFQRGADGPILVLLQGLERVRIQRFPQTEPYFIAQTEKAPDEPSTGIETEALVRRLRVLFRELGELGRTLPEQVLAAAEGVTDPRQLAYLIAGTASLPRPGRQEVLELDPVAAKLRRLVELLEHELSVRRVEQEVASRTQQRMTKQQREQLLREQLRSIQSELDEEGEEGSETAELRKRVEKTPLSAEARREAERELTRLEQIPPISPEFGIARGYLDWLLALPWGKETGGTIDIARARLILDEDHYDLEKIKERILDYLSVRKLRQERQATVSLSGAGDAEHVATAGPVPQTSEDEARREPILCFVGPPGVGKTSLGQSIARAMGRRFLRISLGGVHDEAEIRGHRRTYVGALPGRLIQAIRRAETMDPVFMLDEVDKLGASFHGNPAAALLEVLDPAQNNAFVDTYLGVPFDLSKVLFICTANTIETIAPPLLDRMEVVTLSGYTEAEKLHIARRYLLPKQLRAHGLRDGELEVDDGAIQRIIADYSREAGVRQLERELATVARKAARRIGEGESGPIQVSAESLPALLGRPRFFNEVAERVDRPGVATGLAWTPVGGEILFVEAALVPGQGAPVLTGMLGDVMRESAQAAVTFVRSNAQALGVDPKVFQENLVHIHVPAGAIPKDGPSAGVAMLCAVASVARGIPVRNDTAMTGEITLRGKVLPIGGVKEKVLAAYRARIERVILPRRNEADLEDVPSEVKEKIRFFFADSAADVLEAAFAPERPHAAGPTEVPVSPPPIH
ncbi:MAG: endopeptidase La [Myxococcaceae bacterium]